MQKRLISTLILVGYSVFLTDVLVFKNIPTVRIGHLMFNFGGTDANGQENFLPFKTILSYLFGEKGWLIAITNLVGNIALLVPIGFLPLLLYPKMTWQKSLVLAVLAGLTIEMMQVVFGVGIFDVDDVMLNAIGVMFGYWAFAPFDK